MLTNNTIRVSVSLICCSLIAIKFFSFFYESITFLFFIFWSFPFIIFIYLANKLSIKAFQSFSSILIGLVHQEPTSNTFGKKHETSCKTRSFNWTSTCSQIEVLGGSGRLLGSSWTAPGWLLAAPRLENPSTY